MNSIVCIKQVPNTANITINPETGTLNRAGVESIINPLDLNALEAAVVLKEQFGGTVTVLSMGPAQTEDALLEAIAFGADNAVLCSDKKFAGADTWATAKTLQAAIENIGIPDIIFCGKQAIDGDTAQVPAELAAGLALPFVPYVNGIEPGDNGKAGARQFQFTSMTEFGHRTMQTRGPVLCSVVKSINVPRLIRLSGWQRAFTARVRRLGRDDLQAEDKNLGLRGSPTRVKKITPVSHSKEVRLLHADNKKDLQLICRLLEAAGGAAGPAAPADIAAAERTAQTGPAGAGSAGFDDILIEDLAALRAEKQPLVAVIGEIDSHTRTVKRVSHELFGEAERLAGLVQGSVMVIIPAFQGEAGFAGNAAVVCLDGEVSIFRDVNRYAAVLAEVLAAAAPDIVLAPATMLGRALVPLVAARLETGLTADCTRFGIDEKTGKLLQTRPAFVGNIMATIITPDHMPQMATVRPHVLKLPETGNDGVQVSYYRLSVKGLENRQSGGPAPPPVDIIHETVEIKSTENIGNASIIISGGRGIGKGGSGFALLSGLAELCGASVGASRSAVEAGWAPYHQQVGQTGKTVQPKLYLACGISGAVQHLVGMHDSETIIAINSDVEAPIFKAADYGFVDDYKRVLSKLAEMLKDRRKNSGSKGDV